LTLLKNNFASEKWTSQIKTYANQNADQSHEADSRNLILPETDKMKKKKT